MCIRCGFVESSKNIFRSHIKECYKNNNTGNFICEHKLCRKKTFTTTTQIQHHYLTHYWVLPKIINNSVAWFRKTCWISKCSKLFTSTVEWDQHNRDSHPELTVVDLLPLIIKNKSVVEEVTTIINSKKIQRNTKYKITNFSKTMQGGPCPFCEHAKIFQLHIEAAHHKDGKRAVFCNYCKTFIPYHVEFGSSIDLLLKAYQDIVQIHELDCDHKRIRTGKESGFCIVCKVYKSHLKDHYWTIHNLRVQQCPLCGKHIEKRHLSNHKKECTESDVCFDYDSE
jgi:hypothetical protein